MIETRNADSVERQWQEDLIRKLSAFVAKRSLSRARWIFLATTPLYAAIVLYIHVFKAPLELFDMVGFVGMASTISALIAFIRSHRSQPHTDA